MERLTYKNYIEGYEVNFEKSSDRSWSIAESDTHIKVTGEPIEKLGELEDILESWHIENLEELKIRLNDCQVYHFQNNSNETLIHNLKNELAELKQSQNQKAIEELEKLKDFFLEPYRDEEMDTEFLITKDAGQIADYILDQIKHLKEKNNEN